MKMCFIRILSLRQYDV